MKKWPLKVSLVPLKAEYLESEKICLAADCTAFACQSFHQRYTKDKTLLIACPRLEDKEELTNRLAEIFIIAKAKQIDIIRMEVPCCTLSKLVDDALAQCKGKLECEPKVQVRMLKTNGIEPMPKMFG